MVRRGDSSSGAAIHRAAEKANSYKFRSNPRGAAATLLKDLINVYRSRF
jgi:hypothetical protein